jgi:hypothetical protein
MHRPQNSKKYFKNNHCASCREEEKKSCLGATPFWFNPRNASLVSTPRHAITHLCPACPGCFKQETSSWRIVHAIHIIFHSAMGEYAV